MGQPTGFTSHPGVCIIPPREFPVPFLTDFYFVSTHLVSAMRASHKTQFSLAERTIYIGASEYVKMAQPIFAFFTKPMTSSHPLQKALTPQMRKIGPGCSAGIVKLLNEIA
jgi:hypothetical protein